MGSEITPDKLTKTYIKIRAKRSALSAQYKEADAKLIKQQDSIKRALLDHCDRHNTESVRTSEGLFFRSTKTKYYTDDWDLMYEFIREHNVPEFFDRRLNQTNVRQFLEENPNDVPPSLKIDKEQVITVRKVKK
jgi:hypothetical protein